MSCKFITTAVLKITASMHWKMQRFGNQTEITRLALGPCLWSCSLCASGTSMWTFHVCSLNLLLYPVSSTSDNLPFQSHHLQCIWRHLYTCFIVFYLSSIRSYEKISNILADRTENSNPRLPNNNKVVKLVWRNVKILEVKNTQWTDTSSCWWFWCDNFMCFTGFKPLMDRF